MVQNQKDHADVAQDVALTRDKIKAHGIISMSFFIVIRKPRVLRGGGLLSVDSL